MNKTSIEWTGMTWNPLRGCSHVSEGCRNCYAERIAARFADDRFFSFAENGKWTGRVELIEDKLDEPLRRRKPFVIFVNSMSDTFHEKVPDEWIDRMFAVMALCPQHKFLVLTKRAKRMREYWRDPAALRDRRSDALLDPRIFPGDPRRAVLGCPSRAGVAEGTRKGWRDLTLPNVGLGVSVEDRKHLDRIEDLRNTPAAMRFLSLEPLLEDLGTLDLTGISWVICGGESGPGARPMHPDWPRSLRDQCAAAGIPFHLKRWGEWVPGSHDRNEWFYPYCGPAGGASGVNLHKWGGGCASMRVGKKAAGRLLDGKLWDQRPEGWV